MMRLRKTPGSKNSGKVRRKDSILAIFQNDRYFSQNDPFLTEIAVKKKIPQKRISAVTIFY